MSIFNCCRLRGNEGSHPESIELRSLAETHNGNLSNVIFKIRKICDITPHIGCCGLISYVASDQDPSRSLCQRAVDCCSSKRYLSGLSRARLTAFVQDLCVEYGEIAVGLAFNQSLIDIDQYFECGMKLKDSEKSILKQQANVFQSTGISCLRLSKSQADWKHAQMSCVETLSQESSGFSFLFDGSQLLNPCYVDTGYLKSYEGESIPVLTYVDTTFKTGILGSLNIGYLTATLQEVYVSDLKDGRLKPLSLGEAMTLVAVVIDMIILMGINESSCIKIEEIMALITLLLFMKGKVVINGAYHPEMSSLSSSDKQKISELKKRFKTLLVDAGVNWREHPLFEDEAKASSVLFEHCSASFIGECHKAYRERGTMNSSEQRAMFVKRPGDVASIFGCSKKLCFRSGGRISYLGSEGTSVEPDF